MCVCAPEHKAPKDERIGKSAPLGLELQTGAA